MKVQGFVGPAYTLRATAFDCQRTVNLYPVTDEMQNSQDGTVSALLATPGISFLAGLGEGPVRGIYTSTDNQLFVVSGVHLYLVASDWTYEILGSTTVATTPVSMIDNGSTLVLVDGISGYYVDLVTHEFAEIDSGTGYLPADTVQFLDGLFLTNVKGTNAFQNSSLYWPADPDPEWDANTYKVDANPDSLVTILVNNSEIWCFGERTTEVWLNTGNPSPDRFQRIGGAVLAYGCAAVGSPAKIDNTLFWLGSDDKGAGIVWAAKGLQPQRISTYALEVALRDYETLADAHAFTYQEDGHNFYVLNFPTAKTSWCFDVSTGMWHERQSIDGFEFNRARPSCHAYAFGKHVVGDYQNGNIYEQSVHFYSDNGAPIPRIRTCPHIVSETKRMQFHSFTLRCQPGVGTYSEVLLAGSYSATSTTMLVAELGVQSLGIQAGLAWKEGDTIQLTSTGGGNPGIVMSGVVTYYSGQSMQVNITESNLLLYEWGSWAITNPTEVLDVLGEDPKVGLQWSDDGGNTWTPLIWQYPGKAGQYRHRTVWRRLGYSRDRVWKIYATDPVQWAFLEADMEATVMSS